MYFCPKLLYEINKTNPFSSYQIHNTKENKFIIVLNASDLILYSSDMSVKNYVIKYVKPNTSV